MSTKAERVRATAAFREWYSATYLGLAPVEPGGCPSTAASTLRLAMFHTFTAGYTAGLAAQGRQAAQEPRGEAPSVAPSTPAPLTSQSLSSSHVTNRSACCSRYMSMVSGPLDPDADLSDEVGWWHRHFRLSSHARTVIHKLKVNTLRELAGLSADHVRIQRWAGPVTMKELNALLVRAGLTFADGPWRGR